MIDTKKGSLQIPAPAPIPATDEGIEGLHNADEVLTSLKLLNTEIAERKAEKLRLENAVKESIQKLEDANKELIFQNQENEKRAAELIIANKEILFQNQEKEKRANELILANKELAFQNKEKEKRAAELIIANKELAFQNKEKEKRADELVIANNELVFQNEEKEKRAAELIIANKELLAFTFISSHDLQEPLRKIQTFADRILQTEHTLSAHAKDYFNRINIAARRMQTLIEDLLAYSHTNITERKFEKADLTKILEEVKNDLAETILEKNAVIESEELCEAFVNISQFRQVMHNLVANALKFSKPGIPPHIVIKNTIADGMYFEKQNPALFQGRLSPKKKYCHISFADNGIGFEPQYQDRIFEVFQRLHGRETYAGTGIGLAIVKKIIDNHGGVIIASGEVNKGATFDIYIPTP